MVSNWPTRPRIRRRGHDEPVGRPRPGTSCQDRVLDYVLNQVEVLDWVQVLEQVVHLKVQVLGRLG